MTRVILVEDSPEKADRVMEVIKQALPDTVVDLRTSLTDALDAIEVVSYDLMVLDISMDIVVHSRSMMRDNHDMLGGLRFAKELYLNELELPTIVVTAHDSFIEKNSSKSKISSFMSITQLSNEFEQMLGNEFLGCVSYQKEGWQSKLQELTMKAFTK